MLITKPIEALIVFIIVTALVQFYIDLGHPQQSIVAKAMQVNHTMDDHTSGHICMLTANGTALAWKKETLLDWNDFKAEEKNSPGQAVATSNTGFGFTITKKGFKPQGHVFAHFYCSGSWKKPGLLSDQVLAHEQRHFDICELYSRKFLASIDALKAEQNFNYATLRTTYDELNKEFAGFQEQYDEETKHSMDAFAQKLWNGRIIRELEQLEQYALNRNF